MTNPATQMPGTPANSPAIPAESRKMLLKEIGTKWDKFSEHDVSALTGRDSLVTQIVARYGLEKGQAERDADAFLKGRKL
jgi:hypothetical protein